jgi:hypothetical protein
MDQLPRPFDMPEDSHRKANFSTINEDKWPGISNRNVVDWFWVQIKPEWQSRRTQSGRETVPLL